MTTEDTGLHPIHIGAGLIAEAGQHIAPLAGNKRVAVVSDDVVQKLHLPPLLASLEQAGLTASTHCIPSGEASKSFQQLETLCHELLEAGIARDDCIVALGGGVVGDLAGFAAAILRRGTQLVQMPTTLLAQVDSALGGKTAINTPHGKNLIGAFHQPALVLSDIGALATLPPRELKAGYAEIVKYAVLGKSAYRSRHEDFFGWLEANHTKVLACETEAATLAIRESCAAKNAVVAADEHEHGIRALLNLGHTFGHGLEKLFGYDGTLLHGEAVALGMTLAFDFSVARQHCPPEHADRLRAHLAAVGLPVCFADIGNKPISADALLDAMTQDKKIKGGKARFILARGLGDIFIADDVEPPALRDFLLTHGAT